MSSAHAPAGKSVRVVSYDDFQGLDLSRDQAALDTGRRQHLSQLDNCYCDWRGQIVRDPPAKRRMTVQGLVQHIRWFSSDCVTAAVKTGKCIELHSDRSHMIETIYPPSSIVSSTVFNRRALFSAPALPPYRYDGIIFRQAEGSLSRLGFGFAVPIQRRLAAAGIPGRETRIELSRVDNEEIWSSDEPEDSSNTLRAGFIDIKNLLGTSEVIAGLAPFEQDRLAVFTSDRVLMYAIDPNIDQWTLDERANIRVGAISHNAISLAGSDIIFCSRAGVNTVRRSPDNGITMFSLTLSEKIDILYRSLVRSVEDQRLISTLFDQDEAKLHIFFPQPGGIFCRRLTLSVNPEGGQPQPKWSTGTFLNAHCGDFLAGNLAFGGNGGIFDIAETSDSGFELTPEATVVTPWLWHGSLTDTKESSSIIIQASGKGRMNWEAINTDGRVIWSDTFEIDDSVDDEWFGDVPLFRQYERKFEQRYRGVRFRIRFQGDGVMRLIGFAVALKSQKR